MDYVSFLFVDMMKNMWMRNPENKNKTETEKVTREANGKHGTMHERITETWNYNNTAQKDEALQDLHLYQKVYKKGTYNRIQLENQ